MILYLAGGMGRTFPESVWRPRFAEAAAALEEAGYIVFNPADRPTSSDHAGVALGVGLIASELIDAVALLDGWQESRGARLEEYSDVA